MRPDAGGDGDRAAMISQMHADVEPVGQLSRADRALISAVQVRWALRMFPLARQTWLLQTSKSAPIASFRGQLPNGEALTIADFALLGKKLNIANSQQIAALAE